MATSPKTDKNNNSKPVDANYSQQEPISESAVALIGTAYAFQLVNTIIFGILLFPLLWNIPVLRKIKKAQLEKRKPSIALAVVTLVFCNLISGILLINVASASGGH